MKSQEVSLEATVLSRIGSRELFILIFVPLNVVLGLLFESYGATRGWTWSETAVSMVTGAHFAFYFWRPPILFGFPVTRATLLSCLILATLGELLLSAVLGLYFYRSSVLPAFVPPGHVLLFLTGVTLANHPKCERWLNYAVPLIALIPLSYAWFNGSDFLSLPLYAIFVACLIWGRDPKLYSVMFVLALGLELLGTGVSAWMWTPELPWVGLRSANPPIAAGVFYAVLDLLTFYVLSFKPRNIS